MFICLKTVITYFCVYSPASRSASWISCATSHLFSLLLLGLLGMLCSYRPNSTAHPHHCHHVTSCPEKVTYLILWLFFSLPSKRWFWNWFKIIALLCPAIMKENLGHGAQIVPLIWGYGKLWTLRSLKTDISCFSNLLSFAKSSSFYWKLVCPKERREGWEGELGKSPAGLLNFDSKKPKNGSLHYLR